MRQYVHRKTFLQIHHLIKCHLLLGTAIAVVFVAKALPIHHLPAWWWLPRWLPMCIAAGILSLAVVRQRDVWHIPPTVLQTGFRWVTYHLYHYCATAAHTLPWTLCSMPLRRTDICRYATVASSCLYHLCHHQAQCSAGADAVIGFCPQVCSTAIIPSCEPLRFPNWFSVPHTEAKQRIVHHAG